MKIITMMLGPLVVTAGDEGEVSENIQASAQALALGQRCVRG